ncbi:hypothetical protein GCM10022255_110230 [Dactylosporangium darangshiense]|uniref:Tox-PL domain-containing protein n=1 Tax=Dactylosporangium darangshiense TaxID=579108 RepID=A0ABP8DUS2_9ACTN
MVGDSERAYAETIGKVLGPGGYLPLASRYVHRMGLTLQDLGLKVEYAKYSTLLVIVDLMQSFSFFLVTAWLVPGEWEKFLAKVLWDRFRIQEWMTLVTLAVGESQLVGVSLQVEIDALAQLIQFQRGSRKHWDFELTGNAAKVGSWIGAIGMLLGPVGHLTGGGGKLVKPAVGGGADALLVKTTTPVAKDGVGDAIGVAGRQGPHDRLVKDKVVEDAADPALSGVAKHGGDDTVRPHDVPGLGGEGHAGGGGIAPEMLHEGLVGVVGEGSYGAVTGQDWQWSSTPHTFFSEALSGGVEGAGRATGRRLRQLTDGAPAKNAGHHHGTGSDRDGGGEDQLPPYEAPPPYEQQPPSPPLPPSAVFDPDAVGAGNPQPRPADADPARSASSNQSHNRPGPAVADHPGAGPGRAVGGGQSANSRPVAWTPQDVPSPATPDQVAGSGVWARNSPGPGHVAATPVAAPSGVAPTGGSAEATVRHLGPHADATGNTGTGTQTNPPGTVAAGPAAPTQAPSSRTAAALTTPVEVATSGAPSSPPATTDLSEGHASAADARDTPNAPTTHTERPQTLTHPTQARSASVDAAGGEGRLRQPPTTGSTETGVKLGSDDRFRPDTAADHTPVLLGRLAGSAHRPGATTSGPVHRSESEILSAYPWLRHVNPYLVSGGLDGGFSTNCVITAIATDLSLQEGVGHQAGAAEELPASALVSYQRQQLGLADDQPGVVLRVKDLDSVRAVLAAAEVGARGLVLVRGAASKIAHAFNVVRDESGVAFLDGQRGTVASLPEVVTALEFLPTTPGIGIPAGARLLSGHELAGLVGAVGSAAVVAADPSAYRLLIDWPQPSRLLLSRRSAQLRAIDRAVEAYRAVPQQAVARRLDRLSAVQEAIAIWTRSKGAYLTSEASSRRGPAVLRLGWAVDVIRRELLHNQRPGFVLPDSGRAEDAYDEIAVYSAPALIDHDGDFLDFIDDDAPVVTEPVAASRARHESARVALASVSGHNPGELGIRLQMLRDAARSAYQDFRNRHAVGTSAQPTTTVGLFTLPEWFFKRAGVPFTAADQQAVVNEALSLSAEYPHMIIVPGTTLWASQPANGRITLHNTAVAVLNGRLLHEVHKVHESGDTVGYFPPAGPNTVLARIRRSQFQEGVRQSRTAAGTDASVVFEVGRLRFSLEICLDHGHSRARRDLTAVDGGGAHVQILVSNGADLGNLSGLRPGGVAVSNDGQLKTQPRPYGAERRVYQRPLTGSGSPGMDPDPMLGNIEYGSHSDDPKCARDQAAHFGELYLGSYALPVPALAGQPGSARPRPFVDTSTADVVLDLTTSGRPGVAPADPTTPLVLAATARPGLDVEDRPGQLDPAPGTGPLPGPATRDQELELRYSHLAGPRAVQQHERDGRGEVRLNPFWYRLDELPPQDVLDRKDTIWSYTVDENGDVLVGTADGRGLRSEEQWDQLLASVRRVEPDLTSQRFRELIDGQGHPTLAVGFDAEGRTVVRPARVTGELLWNDRSERWEINNRSNSYMPEVVRGHRPRRDVDWWLANAARQLSERLGKPVATAPPLTTQQGQVRPRPDQVERQVRAIVTPYAGNAWAGTSELGELTGRVRRALLLGEVTVAGAVELAAGLARLHGLQRSPTLRAIERRGLPASSSAEKARDFDRQVAIARSYLDASVIDGYRERIEPGAAEEELSRWSLVYAHLHSDMADFVHNLLDRTADRAEAAAAVAAIVGETLFNRAGVPTYTGTVQVVLASKDIDRLSRDGELRISFPLVASTGGDATALAAGSTQLAISAVSAADLRAVLPGAVVLRPGTRLKIANRQIVNDGSFRLTLIEQSQQAGATLLAAVSSAPDPSAVDPGAADRAPRLAPRLGPQLGPDGVVLEYRAGVPNVRLFTVVPHRQVLRRVDAGTSVASGFAADVQQDPETGRILFASAPGGGLLAITHRPELAMMMLGTALAAGEDGPNATLRAKPVPVLRSYLVPLRDYTALTEAARVNSDRDDIYADMEPDILLVRPGGLVVLAGTATPDSVLTYRIDPGSLPAGEMSGALEDLAGLGGTPTAPSRPLWPVSVDLPAESNDADPQHAHHTLRNADAELRELLLAWWQSGSATSGPAISILSGGLDAWLRDGRRRWLDVVLQANGVDPAAAPAVDHFMNTVVLPWTAWVSYRMAALHERSQLLDELDWTGLPLAEVSELPERRADAAQRHELYRRIGEELDTIWSAGGAGVAAKMVDAVAGLVPPIAATGGPNAAASDDARPSRAERTLAQLRDLVDGEVPVEAGATIARTIVLRARLGEAAVPWQAFADDQQARLAEGVSRVIQAAGNPAATENLIFALIARTAADLAPNPGPAELPVPAADTMRTVHVLASAWSRAERSATHDVAPGDAEPSGHQDTVAVLDGLAPVFASDDAILARLAQLREPERRAAELRRRVDQLDDPFDVLRGPQPIVTDEAALTLAETFLAAPTPAADESRTSSVLRAYAGAAWDSLLRPIRRGGVQAVVTAAIVAAALDALPRLPANQSVTAVATISEFARFIGVTGVATNRFPLPGSVDRLPAELPSGQVGVRIRHRSGRLLADQGQAILAPGGQLRVTRIVDTLGMSDNTLTRVYHVTEEETGPASGPANGPAPASGAASQQAAIAPANPAAVGHDSPDMWSLWNRNVAHVLHGARLARIVEDPHSTDILSGAELRGYLAGLRMVDPEQDPPSDAPPMIAALHWIWGLAIAGTSDAALDTLWPAIPPGCWPVVEVTVHVPDSVEAADRLGAWVVGALDWRLELGLTRWAQRRGTHLVRRARVRHVLHVAKTASTDAGQETEDAGQETEAWVRVRFLGAEPVPPSERRLHGQRARLLDGRSILVARDPVSRLPVDEARLAIEELAAAVAARAVAAHRAGTPGPTVVVTGQHHQDADWQDALAGAAAVSESFRGSVFDKVAGLLERDEEGVPAAGQHDAIGGGVRWVSRLQAVVGRAGSTLALPTEISVSDLELPAPVDDADRPERDWLSGWRTSSVSADGPGWWRPAAPLRGVDQIARSLPPSAYRTVRTENREMGDPYRTAWMLTFWGCPVVYDVVRVEVAENGSATSRTVRIFRLRLHLDPAPGVSDSDVRRLEASATRAVQERLNERFQLPDGDQFHLLVEFTDRDQAHQVIQVPATPHARVTCVSWPVSLLNFAARDAESLLLHEMLHLLGLVDEYASFPDGGPLAIFRASVPSPIQVQPPPQIWRSGRRMPRRTDSPMLMGDRLLGARAVAPAEIVPRYLMLIWLVQESQVVPLLIMMRRDGDSPTVLPDPVWPGGPHGPVGLPDEADRDIPTPDENGRLTAAPNHQSSADGTSDPAISQRRQKHGPHTQRAMPSRVGAVDGHAARGGASAGLRWWHPDGDRQREFANRFGWLGQVNDGLAGGGRPRPADTVDDWLANCLLTAIATHQTLSDETGESVFVAPPIEDRTGLPIQHLIAYANDSRGEQSGSVRPRTLLPVGGFAAIAQALAAAEVGAHGFVVVNGAVDGAPGHVFNAARDVDGVVFLDGQTGGPASLPADPAAISFIAVGPVDVAVAGQAMSAGDLDIVALSKNVVAPQTVLLSVRTVAAVLAYRGALPYAAAPAELTGAAADAFASGHPPAAIVARIARFAYTLGMSAARIDAAPAARTIHPPSHVSSFDATRTDVDPDPDLELDFWHGELAGPSAVRPEDATSAASCVSIPIWYRLDDLPPDLVLNHNHRDVTWLYTVDEDGEIVIGSEGVDGLLGDAELAALHKRVAIAEGDPAHPASSSSS